MGHFYNGKNLPPEAQRADAPSPITKDRCDQNRLLIHGGSYMMLPVLVLSIHFGAKTRRGEQLVASPSTAGRDQNPLERPIHWAI